MTVCSRGSRERVCMYNRGGRAEKKNKAKNLNKNAFSLSLVQLGEARKLIQSVYIYIYYRCGNDFDAIISQMYNEVSQCLIYIWILDISISVY